MITWDNIVEGARYGPIPFVISAEAIAKYVDAVHDQNPLYRDESAARSAGFRGLVAPPTFASVLIIDALKRALPDRPPGGVHARQQFAFHEAMIAGEQLETAVRVLRKYELRGREYTEIEMTTMNQSGQTVFDGVMTSIWPQ